MCNPTGPKINDPITKIDSDQTEEICGYTKTCTTTPPVTLAFVQDLLQKSEKATESVTALVYPHLFPDRLEILVVPASGQEIRKVITNIGKDKADQTLKEEIDATVFYLLNSIRDPSSEDYLPTAQKLYDWLIRPIESDLEAAEIKTLVFVMSGSLGSVPISVLHDGKKFLVQKYALATVPSMGLVNLQLRDRRRDSILAMGLTEKMQGFDEIPNVGIEVNTISSQILQGNAFLNQEFTIANLIKQQQQKNYGIVHLATHAQFLSDTAEGAFIQMWNERLSLGQLRTIRIGQESIELLVLSACKTAVGQNLGLSGVAIIYRAKSVLASLWNVGDAGTTPLMMAFYRNYPTAKSKAIAIQQAQIELLDGTVKIEDQQIKGIPNLPPITLKKLTEDIDLKHPYFWSSFILVGNWL
jgi:CHAT domain-containing protein